MEQLQPGAVLLADLLVRNLCPPLPKLSHGALLDTYVEISTGSSSQFDRSSDGESVYRSGLVRNSVNPSWSLSVGKALLCSKKCTVCARVFAVPPRSSPRHARGLWKGLNVDPADVKAASLVLEERFSLEELVFTGVTTKELAQLGALPLNTVLCGLRNPNAVAEMSFLYTTKDNLRYFQSSPPPALPQSQDSSNSSEAQTEADTALDAAPLGLPCLGWKSVEGHVHGGETRIDTVVELRRMIATRNSEILALQRKLEAAYAQSSAVALKNLEKEAVRRRCELLAAYREKREVILEQKREQKALLEKIIEKRAAHVQRECEGLLTLENNTGAQVKREAQRAAEWLKERILLESCKLDLVARLSSVYPVEERYSEKGFVFSIRGLAVPHEDSRGFGMNDEERISTALGYIAHMTMLLSKYMHVPLRFIPQYKGSRSCILDPAVTCSLAPTEPSPRFGNLVYAFDTHLFGTASGRIPSSVAKQAIEESKCPLYWRGLNHASKHKVRVCCTCSRACLSLSL